MKGNSKFTRRWFIGGAASFGALAGCRLLDGGAFASSGKPALRLGVVSDIHFSVDEGLVYYPDHGEETLVKALEFFRERNVDGVVICGDLADRSLGEELMGVGRAWERVFPNDRAPDGHHVEKLFITGNHDWEGFTYGFNARRVFPDAAERARHIIRNDLKGWWDRAFHEEYRPIWMKQVNGYSFIGAGWLLDRGTKGDFNPGLEDFYAAHGKELDPKLPFFHLQHPPLKNTCFAPWGGASDAGVSTRILSNYPNAIAFSGHTHYTLTDPRCIWQGAFTSIGCSSLRGTGVAPDELFRQERFVCSGGMPSYRQGMQLDVYSDHIDFDRRDFRTGLPLGQTLTMPLPAVESKPFAYAEHAKRLAAPEFLDGYALVLEPNGADMMKLLIPAVKPDSSARCSYYEAVCKSGDKSVRKRILPLNWAMSTKDKLYDAPTVVSIPLKDLPAEPIAVTVTPVGYFGKRGKSLSAVFSQAKWRA